MSNKFCRRGWSFAVLIAALTAFIPTSHAQYAGTNGIFAEFNTSMGSYTCRLEFTYAPKACANFIALATGARSWLDLPSGVVKTNPFYNGTTFHRVIAGFMNQGGSPNGLGTDGPGYTFVDEFTPSLRHDGFGILSSANSGPDSNGSQYFVTVEPTPWLNDVHTIFGKLYGGSNVVYAINNVATDGSSKPLTNVTVNSIKIQRIGLAAAAFDINAQGLPLVTNLNLKIAKTGPNISLTFSNRLYADNRLYTSTSLTGWSASQLGIEVAGAVSGSLTQGISGTSRFFRAAQIQYPSSTFGPKTIYNRTLTLTFTNGGSGTLTMVFNSAGGGTYTFGASSGNILGYAWFQLPYNGKIQPIVFTGLADTTLALNFDTANAGGYTGVQYPFGYPITFGASAFSGSFTISP